MDQIFRHLEYLALRHEKISLPGLGCVCVHKLPARYVETEGLYYPPRRTFSFDYLAKEDDGRLALSIARKESISIDEARELVRVSVAMMTDTLRCGEKVVMGHIGVLRTDEDNVAYFTPGDANAISPEHIWLREVRLARPQIAAGSAAMTPAPLQEDGIGIDEEQPLSGAGHWRRFRALSKYAALVVVAAAVAVAIFVPAQKETALQASMGLRKLISRGDAMPLQDNAAVTLENAPTMVVVIEKKDRDPEENEAESQKTEIQESAALSPALDDEYLGNDGGKYCLVVASLASEDEAARYIAGHPGEGLQLLVKDGRYRVYAASGDDKARIDRLCRRVSESGRYAGAWVSRR